MKGNGEYTEDWPSVSRQRKEEAGGRCKRCKHIHEPSTGYTLTVHHLDGNKGKNAWWNTPALCQRCHLFIQARIRLPQFTLFEPEEWFKPYYEGYCESMRLGNLEHRLIGI
jgi:hypothetical protein